jgi:hypothetical protein
VQTQQLAVHQVLLPLAAVFRAVVLVDSLPQLVNTD